MNRRWMSALVVGVCLVSTAPAAQGSFPELFKLTASDAQIGNRFGQFVAISGTSAIIGAPYNDDAGQNAGAAYLFDAATGTEAFKLMAPDASEGDEFGHSVGISGGMAIIGARYYDDFILDDCGAAYVFDVATGHRTRRLLPSDGRANSYFGNSVAISGNIAIVGEPYDDGAGAMSNSGSAYLFNAATGQQLHKLTASDAASDDWFGLNVAISGGVAIVGAYGNDDAGDRSGSAYLFDVATGQQLHKLTAFDPASYDYFGRSVAIDGNVAMVGAFNKSGPATTAGAAYVFDVTTGQQVHKLTASDAAADDQFGTSVAISGNIAVVGASRDSDAGSYSGSAYVFNAVTGAQCGKLTASDAAAYDRFGASAAISGDLALVGAWGNEDAGTGSGSAYLYEIPEPASALLFAAVGLITTALRRRRGGQKGCKRG